MSGELFILCHFCPPDSFCTCTWWNEQSCSVLSDDARSILWRILCRGISFWKCTEFSPQGIRLYKSEFQYQQIVVKFFTARKSHYPSGNRHLITRHWHSGNNQSVGSSVLVVSRWLWPGNRTFMEVASMVVGWWILAFSHSAWSHMKWGLFCTFTLWRFYCVRDQEVLGH